MATEYGFFETKQAMSQDLAAARLRLVIAKRMKLLRRCVLIYPPRVLESMFILETYRVVLLQRPPALYATACTPSLQGLQSIILQQSGQPQESAFMPDIDFETLLTPHARLPGLSRPQSMSICLNGLIALSWHCKGPITTETNDGPMYNPELVELAFHRWSTWVSSSSAEPTIVFSKRILFHLALMNMHCNMNLIHKYARAHTMQTKTREAIHNIVQAWYRSSESSTAVSHATELVRLAKDWLVFGPVAVQDVRREPPHIAIGVYLAALVLWAATTSRPDSDDDAIRSILEGAIYTLSTLRMRTAKMLGDDLRRLASISLV